MHSCGYFPICACFRHTQSLIDVQGISIDSCPLDISRRSRRCIAGLILLTLPASMGARQSSLCFPPPGYARGSATRPWSVGGKPGPGSAGKIALLWSRPGKMLRSPRPLAYGISCVKKPKFIGARARATLGERTSPLFLLHLYPALLKTMVSARSSFRN